MTLKYTPTTTSILLLFLLNFQPTFGQDFTDKLILTQEQNDKWIAELETSPLNKQLNLITTRILLDTNVYVRSSYPDRIKVQDESDNGKKTQSFGRPLITIDGKCEHNYLNITNRTSNKSLRHLTELINEDNIERVTIYKDVKATAIYGSRATAGVIVLTIKNKRTCKRIKEIDFGGM